MMNHEDHKMHFLKTTTLLSSSESYWMRMFNFCNSLGFLEWQLFLLLITSPHYSHIKRSLIFFFLKWFKVLPKQRTSTKYYQKIGVFVYFIVVPLNTFRSNHNFAPYEYISSDSFDHMSAIWRNSAYILYRNRR